MYPFLCHPAIRHKRLWIQLMISLQFVRSIDMDTSMRKQVLNQSCSLGHTCTLSNRGTVIIELKQSSYCEDRVESDELCHLNKGPSSSFDKIKSGTERVSQTTRTVTINLKELSYSEGRTENVDHS